MGLIIKNAIKKMFKGYPTVSDKYNVAGATNEGPADINFGDVVVYGSQTGFYKKASNITAATQIAGICLATNVKSALQYPAEAEIATKTGEQFNLFLDGYIAIELDAAATTIVAGAAVYVTATGTITNVADDAFALPGAIFTGETETIGSTKLAEIRVK